MFSDICTCALNTDWVSVGEVVDPIVIEEEWVEREIFYLHVAQVLEGWTPSPEIRHKQKIVINMYEPEATLII